MKRNVYLKNISQNTPQTLLIRKSFLGNSFKYSVGIKVIPKNWDSKNKVVLPSDKNHKYINSYINKVLEYVDESFFIVLSEDCRYDQKKMKSIIDKKINRIRK